MGGLWGSEHLPFRSGSLGTADVWKFLPLLSESWPPSPLAFSNFCQASAPGCWLDHLRVEGGVTGRTCCFYPSSAPEGQSKTNQGGQHWLTSCPGPVCTWQLFQLPIITWPRMPRLRCGFRRPAQAQFPWLWTGPGELSWAAYAPIGWALPCGGGTGSSISHQAPVSLEP